MNPDFDAIIIGARVAGSIVATLLGKQNRSVLVLDRAYFPSDTLSTHFFRYPTFDSLKRLDLAEEVHSVAPHLVNNFNDVDGHVFSEPVVGPDGPSHYLCVRRITLDAILFERLQQEQTVTIRQGAVVDGIIREENGVTGVRWTQDGTRHEASARVVVGADGVRSITAKSVSPVFENQEPVRRAMYYGYYENLEPSPGPAAEFHYRGNRLVYVFPTDGNLTLLAVSVPIEEFDAFRNNARERFTQEVNAMSALKPRFAKAKLAGPIRGTGSIPGYRRVPFGSGWALVGDSAMIMDPWSGQGIDQASTHAVMLADNLNAWFSGRASWQGAMQEYHRKRNEFSVKTYERTCTFARDLRPMTKAALQKRGLS